MKIKTFFLCKCRSLLLLLAISLFLMPGCASQRPHQAVSLEPIRSQMGTVGVAAAAFDPETSFEGFARGRMSGAGQGASMAALGWMVQGLETVDPFGLLFHVVTLPPVAIGGAIYGAIAAEPKKVIEASGSEAREALAGLLIQRSLQERVVARARADTARTVVLMPEGGPDFPEETRIYPAAGETGVDTVLELAVLEIGSRGKMKSINPPVALFMTARARLLRPHDGLLLYEQNYPFMSERRKFTEWGADNAALLRQAYDRGMDFLAGLIVNNVFLSLSLDNVVRLQAVEPYGPFRRKKVASLQPTFEWEAFPRSEDQEWIGDRRVENVTYDLNIRRVDKLGYHESEVELRGFPEPVHTLEAPLAPNTEYRWFVRARFELQGEVRLTQWSLPAEFKTPRRRIEVPELVVPASDGNPFR